MTTDNSSSRFNFCNENYTGYTTSVKISLHLWLSARLTTATQCLLMCLTHSYSECKGKYKAYHTPLDSVGGCSSPLLGLQPVRLEPVMSHVWPVRCQTYGYLPSHKASLPIGWYQIILLVTEATVCKQLAQGCTQQRGGCNSNSQLVGGKSSSQTTWPLNECSQS